MDIDYEQYLISDLIRVYGDCLKSDILDLRTTGELVEGSNRWKFHDKSRGIEYLIEVKITKKVVE